jgi:hypothetical protein
MKQATIERYFKWKESAKSKDKFTTGGEKYSQSEFESLIGHKPSKVVEPKINTIEEDIQVEEYEDLEGEDYSGDTEES